MLVTCLKIFSGSLIPYKRAGKIISFYIKMIIFGIFLVTYDQNIHQHAPNLPHFLIFLGGSVKSCNVITFIAF